MDEAGYLRRVKEMGLEPGGGLRKLPLEKLPACYTAVIVEYTGSTPRPATEAVAHGGERLG